MWVGGWVCVCVRLSTLSSSLSPQIPSHTHSLNHTHTLNPTHTHTHTHTHTQEEVLNTARALGVLPGFSLLMVDTENKFVSTGVCVCVCVCVHFLAVCMC